MFDWLVGLVEALLDDEDKEEEVFVPEPPQRRRTHTEFSPKLRKRLDNPRPGYTGSHINGIRPLPRVPAPKKPVVPPLWHPMNPHSWLNPNNRQSPFNPYNPNNPNSINNIHNRLNPNSPMNRHRHMNPMNPFGPNHHR